MGMMGKQMPPLEKASLDRLEKMLEGLIGAIGTKKTEQPPKTSGSHGGTGQRSAPQWRIQWTPYGQPICMKCNAVGHIKRDCPKIAQKERQARRRSDGNIVCFGCGERGHTRPSCPKNQQQGQTPDQWQSNAGHNSRQLIGLMGAEDQQVPDPEVPLPILKIDTGRLVTQDVLCGEKRVSAVIDTGKVVSVCSPKLAEELKLQVTAWTRNR